jgi:hypothetical protein
MIINIESEFHLIPHPNFIKLRRIVTNQLEAIRLIARFLRWREE